MHKAAVFDARDTTRREYIYVKELRDLCYLNCKIKLTDHCVFELDSKTPEWNLHQLTIH